MNIKKKIAALAVATAIVGTSGLAYAYWSTTGTGDGEGIAEAGAGDQITLTADFNDGALHPGGSVVVSFTAENENSETDLRVGTVSSAVSTSDPDNCLLTWFRIEDVLQGQTIEAGQTEDLDNTGTLYFDNAPNDSQDACKGATITLTLTSD